MDSMRVFIAVEIPENVQATLDRLIKRLQSKIKNDGLRWVIARNIHITLKFLGEVPIAKLEGLAGLLTHQAASHAPFDIRLGDLGAFPSVRKPRVIWIGIDAPTILAEMQNSIEQGGIQLGFSPEERPFTPHLTLGRIAQGASQDEIRQVGTMLVSGLIPAIPDPPVVFHVDAIHLIRSDLRPTGAVYTRIASAPLAGVTTGQNKPING